MKEILVVGAGGFLGAVARYLLSGWVHLWAGPTFPWGTLAVNVSGCLGLGVLMGWVEANVALAPATRLFLGIGFLASLTTFSTFGYETLELLRRTETTAAVLNVFGNLALGVFAVLAGRELVRWLT